ncbi:MAG: transcriptional activator NhaR [Acidobacteriia bacterium]|nr:transcriptional activator NhaR [Terriglobia bacterium]
MEWLNYHHLLYFWTVARTGSISAASKELRLASPTISNQIHKLEDSLGEELLRRSGRKLVLTDMGRIAMRYADEIFSLGQEFTSTMKERPTGRPLRFCVGIADVLPKVIAFRLIEPALRLRTPIHLICREGRPDHLLADLAVHDVDVVLSDTPASPAANIRAFNHLLGECGVSFVAPKKLAFLKKGFPRSLDGAPFLLPLDNTALRRDLDEWCHSQKLRPVVMGEFADLALLRIFAEEGFGVFAVPSVMEDQMRQYGFYKIGATTKITVRIYAISVERQVRHPAVVAVCETARNGLFRTSNRQPIEAKG